MGNASLLVLWCKRNERCDRKLRPRLAAYGILSSGFCAALEVEGHNDKGSLKRKNLTLFDFSHGQFLSLGNDKKERRCSDRRSLFSLTLFSSGNGPA